LCRDDIDLTRGVVKVRRAVARAGGETIIGPRKTDAGIRDVDISASMLPDVRQHLLDCRLPDGDDGDALPGGRSGPPHRRLRQAFGEHRRAEMNRVSSAVSVTMEV